MYMVMKTIHLTTLIITISGFILRGFWMMRGSPLLQNKIVKTIPHYNDTILLISAVWTGALIGQYPFVNSWLTAKILGALAYIILGGIALTYGPSKQIRIGAFIGALCCFGYVVSVALTKNPLPI
ncbi:MAG: SirB2 family protein [Gammaproteobacteria bacterium]|nr:SirB2 family protein [Gammaproteobacteria bacterium]MCP4090676.1 SirB2 family protein [Gammaproteobacteria bacterium]MCP4276972.1 SirB2 family protein [Gammaproteobacteria bacterium]MCP4832665.1 SirB2 family protein [Gammaproteobacteria bacterium]MCP4930225.1 SirB2 family protein [Gammaproteobacteria bacterium]